MLRTEGVSRNFFRRRGESNYFTAVQPVDFELVPGALTEVTGRSGSGKSTFLNLLAGLLAPTSGKVWLDDVDLYSLPDGKLSRLRNRRFGVIPQGQTALRSLTVLENVLLPCALFGGELPADEARALLEQVGIADLADVKCGELSGGEMRRMAIARALIRRPDVLLADEPTGDLDDANTAGVLELLRGAARQGAAVLLVTHEAEARKYADVVYRMDAGRLTAETQPAGQEASGDVLDGQRRSLYNESWGNGRPLSDMECREPVNH